MRIYKDVCDHSVPYVEAAASCFSADTRGIEVVNLRRLLRDRMRNVL